MLVFITAGGKGTRISSITKDIPKPMIDVCGKPVLQRQIECLKEQGFCDIILSIGHLGNVIRSYFGDGSKFGVSISYYEETEPLGTAGALVAMKEKLQDDFLLLNGDLILDMDFSRMIEFHKKNHSLITLATHPNSHPYDSSLIVTDNEGCVIEWLPKEEKRQYYKNRVNAGVQIISPTVISLFDRVQKLDLDRDIIKPLIFTKRIYAYNTTEYIKDMGTPDRYNTVCCDVENNIVKNKNLSQKQKAIFLDRDGVINVYKGFLKNVEDVELLEGVAQAIKIINEKGYLAIVITNQPVIARGDCTWDELHEINNAIETLLGKEGAYLDDIFICPHHPDKGFEGEVAEYKIICDCRKPKPGLLLQAEKEYNIDLSLSYMVGDSISDIEAGMSAGCRTALINHNNYLDKKNTKCYNSLLDFVKETIG